MKTLLTLCTLVALSGCGGSASILPAVTTLVSLSASSFSVSETFTIYVVKVLPPVELPYLLYKVG